MHRVKYLGAIALVALSLAACGGGGVPPGEYAEEFCGSASDWLDEIQSGAEEMTSKLTPDPEEVKELILGYLEDVIAKTEETIGEIEDIGEPEGAADFHEEALDVFEEAQTAFEDARDQVEELDTSDPQALGTSLQNIGTELQDKGNELQERTSNVPDELQSAFEDEESCSDLGI